MGKVKIHEIAKKLNLNSKEVLEKANEIGIDVKSHLSSIEDKEAEKLEKALRPKTAKKEQPESPKKENSPVIIRREVIISDEEQDFKAQEKKHQEQRKNDVGFVEKNRKTDFNIVYRDKQKKPLTVDELFGIKKEPQKQENIAPQEQTIKNEQIANDQQVIAQKQSTINNNQQQNTKRPMSNVNTQQPSKQRNNYNNQPQNGYNNKNGFNNQRNQSGFNNRNNRPGFNNKNNQNNGGFNKNGFNNQRNQNSFNNKFRENRPLDSYGIEKNIKNIMNADVIEKESIREYQNKSIDKQKNNIKFDDNKKKQNKSKKGSNYEDISRGKLKDLKQSDRLSNMFTEGDMLDYYDLTTQRGRKSKKKLPKSEREDRKQKIFQLTDITISEHITVKDLAADLKKTSSEIIKKLFDYGIMATINNDLDFDTAFLIAQEFGITAHKKEVLKEEDILFDESEDTEDKLQSRPPVVVVMGHVDHGKTSLLDAVRKTNVIEGEAGGITQHIGAYKVQVNGRDITFLDTPGHEAFTSMRARGAQITDIAILVVAANDGVMPQTIEAINHAKAANIPIVVAVNKIDLEGANVEKIKQELTEYGLVPEEWGGDTIFVPISAKMHQNIDTLLEMVLLVADMKELKANPKKQAKGAVIEARLDKSRGPVVTVLVQRGTLDIGDTVIVGSSIGRIRQMINDKGQKVKKAGPSTPVEITGLTTVPTAGDTFYEVKDEKTAKQLIERRKRQERDAHLRANTKITLDNLFNVMNQANMKQLNLIVKADVQGSVEAVKQSLEKLSNDEIRVKVIHSNVGSITESDVNLASVSNAIVIGFNVTIPPIPKSIAEKAGVEVKTYNIIYQAIEDVERAIKGMAEPVYEEKVIGSVEVRQTFKVSNVGTIAGCYVTDGKVTRNSMVRVMRDGEKVFEGKISSLKRFKDDAKEVAHGYECGIEIEEFNDIKEGDILEVYIMEEIKN